MRTSILAIAILTALPAFAVTYVVPTDRELIARADMIAVATALESHTELRGTVVTITRFRVDEALKGPIATGSEFELVERGGVYGNLATFIPGTPLYDRGSRYLIFTDLNGQGESITYGMGIGRFELSQASDGRAIVTRDVDGYDANLNPYADRPRDGQRFAGFIRAAVGQAFFSSDENARRGTPDRGGPDARTPANYFIADSVLRTTTNRAAQTDAFSGFSYLLTSAGQGFRWQTTSASLVLSGSEGTLNGSGAASQAVSAWNGAAAFHYSIAGQDNTATGGLTAPDGKSAILFNDPNNELPAGVQGLGGITSATSTYSWSGGTVWNPAEVDIVVGKAGIFTNQSCLNTVVTHEMGHTLGLRHSDQDQTDSAPCGGGLDCSSAAVMTSATQCGYNGQLQPWDVRAIQAVYGAATGGTGGTSGDVNGDGQTSSSDVFYLINYLFSGGPAPASGRGDVNGDASVSSADVFYLINYLFSAGPAPR